MPATWLWGGMGCREARGPAICDPRCPQTPPSAESCLGEYRPRLWNVLALLSQEPSVPTPASTFSAVKWGSWMIRLCSRAGDAL